MSEVDIRWRLSTVVLLWAVILEARKSFLPLGHSCQQIAAVASGHPTTWAAVEAVERRAFGNPQHQTKGRILVKFGPARAGE